MTALTVPTTPPVSIVATIRQTLADMPWTALLFWAVLLLLAVAAVTAPDLLAVDLSDAGLKDATKNPLAPAYIKFLAMENGAKALAIFICFCVVAAVLAIAKKLGVIGEFLAISIFLGAGLGMGAAMAGFAI